MQIEVTVLVSGACAIIGAYLGFQKANADAEARALKEGHKQGKIEADMQSLLSSVKDMKKMLEESKEDRRKLSEMIQTIKSSASQAHKRIDGLEERLKMFEESIMRK